VGRGSVTFVDGRGVRFDNADECMHGKPLTLSYLRVGIVGAGYTFNLRERELEVLVQARAGYQLSAISLAVPSSGGSALRLPRHR
jgi:cyanophycinase-like exopeptidase